MSEAGKRRTGNGNHITAIFEDNKPNIILFGMIIAVLAVILAGILVMELPAVPVCVVVLLDICIAVCLRDVPIWLHGLIFLAEAVAGAFCSRLVFMLLCAALYVIGILALRFFRDE